MSPQSSGAGRGEPFDPPGVAWCPVSGRLSAARRLAVSPLLLLAAAGFGVASFVMNAVWPMAVVLALIFVEVWAWWLIGRQVAALGYAEQEEDLLVRRGVMFRKIVVVPYGRLQYVEVEAGPLDRMLGISRVQLHTASASTDATIPGLATAEAARLRDRLTERGQARLAGL